MSWTVEEKIVDSRKMYQVSAVMADGEVIGPTLTRGVIPMSIDRMISEVQSTQRFRD
jgi:hypothetical protein